MGGIPPKDGIAMPPSASDGQRALKIDQANALMHDGPKLMSTDRNQKRSRTESIPDQWLHLEVQQRGSSV